MDYTKINSETIDKWVEQGWEWSIPMSHDDFIKAKNGVYSTFLTPIKTVPKHWFPDLKGKKVLGLASGGGQQMPFFAAHGSFCTVMDYSKNQINKEIEVAKRENYEIETVIADMTKTFPFPDATFDLIFFPVANPYIEDMNHVWRECYRVLKTGGLIMSGLDNGMNFVFNDNGHLTNALPFNPLKDEKLLKEGLENEDGVQFSHTIEENIGGQLKAGFTLIDIYEDTNKTDILHKYNIPAYWATLSRK